MMWRNLLCAMLLALAGSAWASEDVLVSNAWLRESVPGQNTVSLQLSLTSIKSAKLIAVSTPLADTVQIQILSPAGRGKMKARGVDSLRLLRRRTVVFGENNVALMLVGLKRELNEGDHVPVTLTVELAGKQLRKVETVAEVRKLELGYKQSSGKTVHDHR